MPGPIKKKDESEWYRLAKYSSVGIEMAASVAVGAGIGFLLDRHFNTEPVFIIIWSFCGIFAGFRSLYRITKKIMKEQKKDEST